MILHARYANLQGSNTVCILSPDTDVMVMMIHHFYSIGAPYLYFQTGKKFYTHKYTALCTYSQHSICAEPWADWPHYFSVLYIWLWYCKFLLRYWLKVCFQASDGKRQTVPMFESHRKHSRYDSRTRNDPHKTCRCHIWRSWMQISKSAPNRESDEE